MGANADVDDLKLRLLGDERDATLRADIRDLVVARLEGTLALSYFEKDNLSKAISALMSNAEAPGDGSAHPKLRFALLQYQLSLLPEHERDDGAQPKEIVAELTHDMLLDAARAVP